MIADTRKPYLENEAYHFSISHCGQYAAAIVSRCNRTGIDIELMTDKIKRIAHKFLDEEEEKVLGERSGQLPLNASDLPLNLLTMAWSTKESVFKWYGKGEVDFRMHMNIKKLIPINDHQYSTILKFKKNEELFLYLHSYFFDDLCLSYVVT